MLRTAGIAEPPRFPGGFFVARRERQPLQDIAWVLGQVTAEGITKVIHAYTLHEVAVRVLVLVTLVATRWMPKPDRPDRTR